MPRISSSILSKKNKDKEVTKMPTRQAQKPSIKNNTYCQILELPAVIAAYELLGVWAMVAVLWTFLVLLLVTGRNKNSPRNTRCARCGIPMTIIPAASISEKLAMRVMGCFQCMTCGRHTCRDCNDSRTLCQCGGKQWIRRFYIRR